MVGIVVAVEHHVRGRRAGPQHAPAQVMGLGGGQLDDPDPGVTRAQLVDRHHAVGDGSGLLAVMGDEQRRGPRLPQDPGELAGETVVQVAVEAGQRLVEQHARGAGASEPGQRHALGLAAAEIGDLAPAEPRQADQVEQLVDRAGAAALGRRRASAGRRRRWRRRRGAGTAARPGRPSRCRGGASARVVMSVPSRMTVPAVGVTSPAMTRSSVLLPLPDGPSRATISPSPTVNETRGEDRWSAEADGDLNDVQHGCSIIAGFARSRSTAHDDGDGRDRQDRRQRVRLGLEQCAGAAEQPFDGDRHRLGAGARQEAGGAELAERDRRRQPGRRGHRPAEMRAA